MGNCCGVLGEKKNLFSWESHCGLPLEISSPGRSRVNWLTHWQPSWDPLQCCYTDVWSPLRLELWGGSGAGVRMDREHFCLGSRTKCYFFCVVVRGSFPVLHHQGEEAKDGVLWLREDLKAILLTQDDMVAAKAHFAAPANAGFCLLTCSACHSCRGFLVSGADRTTYSFSFLIGHSGQLSSRRTVSNSCFVLSPRSFSLFCPLPMGSAQACPWGFRL